MVQHDIELRDVCRLLAGRAKFTTQLVLMLTLTITVTLTLTLTLLLTLTNFNPNTYLKLLQCISRAGQ